MNAYDVKGSFTVVTVSVINKESYRVVVGYLILYAICNRSVISNSFAYFDVSKFKILILCFFIVIVNSD